MLVTPPGAWNPNTDIYARDEENMLDWEGKVVAKQHRQQILLCELEDDEAMMSSLQISTLESRVIDKNFDSQHAFGIDHHLHPALHDVSPDNL